METVLPREIGAPLGHPGRSLRCPRPPRTLRSRRARPDTHERPLLCGRRSRQLLCSRGAPAAEGVEARGGRGGGDRHVLHAIGSVASVGPNGPGALTDGVDHRRPPEALLPPQAEPQPALAVPRTPRTPCRARRARALAPRATPHVVLRPAHRPVLARAGTGAQLPIQHVAKAPCGCWSLLVCCRLAEHVPCV